jgi:hypothetical protein
MFLSKRFKKICYEYNTKELMFPSTAPCRIFDIPNELFLHILSFITQNERLKSAPVSKLWRDIIYSLEPKPGIMILGSCSGYKKLLAPYNQNIEKLTLSQKSNCRLTLQMSRLFNSSNFKNLSEIKLFMQGYVIAKYETSKTTNPLVELLRTNHPLKINITITIKTHYELTTILKILFDNKHKLKQALIILEYTYNQSIAYLESKHSLEHYISNSTNIRIVMKEVQDEAMDVFEAIDSGEEEIDDEEDENFDMSEDGEDDEDYSSSGEEEFL